MAENKRKDNDITVKFHDDHEGYIKQLADFIFEDHSGGAIDQLTKDQFAESYKLYEKDFPVIFHNRSSKLHAFADHTSDSKHTIMTKKDFIDWCHEGIKSWEPPHEIKVSFEDNQEEYVKELTDFMFEDKDGNAVDSLSRKEFSGMYHYYRDYFVTVFHRGSLRFSDFGKHAKHGDGKVMTRKDFSDWCHEAIEQHIKDFTPPHEIKIQFQDSPEEYVKQLTDIMFETKQGKALNQLKWWQFADILPFYKKYFVPVFHKGSIRYKDFATHARHGSQTPDKSYFTIMTKEDFSKWCHAGK